jgi:predicted O-methyltransferase YrrM
MVLRLLQRANYAVIHADALERERHAAAVNFQRLRALGVIDEAGNAITIPSAPAGPSAPGSAENDPQAAALDAGGGTAPAPDAPIVRPLEKSTDDADFADNPSIDKKWVEGLITSKHFAAVIAKYYGYPAGSFVSDMERAFLFCLVRAMKPQAVAEIGTAFCGTAELIARALWENGTGVLHTTDPFGAERAPLIISRWPEPLRKLTQFHPKSSMDFFMALAEAKVRLDIAFIDGDHDFEFAYYDVLMAARLLRPGGIMVIDNSDQTGPYYAAAQFLHDNPDWVELGNALTGFRLSHPFSAPRSSLPKSDCLIIKAPEIYPVGRLPRTTAQFATSSRVAGFSSNIETPKFHGLLHYRLTLRAFRDGNREIEEYKRAGKITLDSSTTGHALTCLLDEPLVSHLNERHGDCHHTLEIELAWEGPDTQRTIHLSAAPLPLVGEADRPRAETVGGNARA